MPMFFNNCRGRDHAGLFGSGAFFDLSLDGLQASMARGLQPGSECVVAAPARDQSGDIVFSWFSLLREREMPAENGRTVRVFFGEALRSERLSRADAIRKSPYSYFFNVNGQFKRPSVFGKSFERRGRRAVTQP